MNCVIINKSFTILLWAPLTERTHYFYWTNNQVIPLNGNINTNHSSFPYQSELARELSANTVNTSTSIKLTKQISTPKLVTAVISHPMHGEQNIEFGVEFP